MILDYKENWVYGLLGALIGVFLFFTLLGGF
jgi:hypothetical protein